MTLAVAVLIVLIFVGFFLVPRESNVMGEASPKRSLSVTSTSSATPGDYQLSWPGMLPDQPLYKVKILRDRLVLWLVKDPVKRIEYYLLLADKGMYATRLLIDKGNVPLALITALKAENNYTLLVTEYRWAYWYAKKLPSDLTQNIQRAAYKHQEILSGIISDLSDTKDKDAFTQVLSFSQRNLDELRALK